MQKGPSWKGSGIMSQLCSTTNLASCRVMSIWCCRALHHPKKFLLCSCSIHFTDIYRMCMWIQDNVLCPHKQRTRNRSLCLGDPPASYVVACAVILQVLDLRPLVTMTANSYMVFGLRAVTVWLSAVVSADWTHNRQIDIHSHLKSLQKQTKSASTKDQSPSNVRASVLQEYGFMHVAGTVCPCVCTRKIIKTVLY